MIQYVKLSLKGFLMGAADVVPGVSGGTMAFILGIYQDLIKAIQSIDTLFFRHLMALEFKKAFNGVAWRFLGALGFGILLAIFTLAKGISWLLHNQPVLVWSFFFGLVLASVLTVTRHVKHWSPILILTSGLAATGAFFLVGLVPAQTPNAPWFLFCSGALAICAMILPGISGSFVLVLLGKYHYILEAVNQRDFLTLFIVASGSAVGLFFFSRLLGYMFKKHHDLTIAVLCGLMLGSLRKVWPWKSIQNLVLDSGQSTVLEKNFFPASWSPEVFMALGLVVLGVFLVLFLDYLAKRRPQAKTT